MHSVRQVNRVTRCSALGPGVDPADPQENHAQENNRRLCWRHLPIIVFVTLQRFFVRGLTAGAVKG